MIQAADLARERSTTAEAIRKEFGDRLPSAKTEVRPDGELVIRVPPGDLVAAARLLAGHRPHALNYLSCVSGVDWPDRGRIEVVYSLYSVPRPVAKVSLRVEADRDLDRASVPSLTPVWPTAEYHEREVFDLFGVRFEAHPDLRRILLDESFVGHPLRKDFVDQRPPRRPVSREDYQP